MSRPARYNPHKSPRRRFWIYAAVIAFVLVDVLLISLAFAALGVDTATESLRPIPTFTPNQATADSAPTPVAASAAAIPSIRLLTALNGNTAWRATTGECQVAANPEFTTDGGNTWLSTDATSDVQVTALQSLNVVSNTLVELVGLSAENCSPQFVKSFVAGDNYSSYPEQLDTRWYIDPIDRSVVHTPAGEVSAPCASVVALVPRADVAGAAAVLCSETQVFMTEDSAETWGDPLTTPGAVNLAVTAVGYVVATVGVTDCVGVQLTSILSGSLEGTPAGCFPLDLPAEMMHGNVAIAEAEGTVWVWAGDSLGKSADNGSSWQ